MNCDECGKLIELEPILTSRTEEDGLVYAVTLCEECAEYKEEI
jgi:hypothetical protein